MPYGSDQGLIDYLAQSGRALPDGADPAVVRYWGSSYVNMFERRYKGGPIALPDSFPRDIYNPTPLSVEYAAYEAGLAWADGVELFGTGGSSSKNVIREKIGDLEVAYSDKAESKGLYGYYENNLFIWPLSYSLLVPYMKVGMFYPAALVVGGRNDRI